MCTMLCISHPVILAAKATTTTLTLIDREEMEMREEENEGKFKKNIHLFMSRYISARIKYIHYV